MTDEAYCFIHRTFGQCECNNPQNYFYSLARFEESIRPEGVEDFLEEFIPLVNRYASREVQ